MSKVNLTYGKLELELYGEVVYKFHQKYYLKFDNGEPINPWLVKSMVTDIIDKYSLRNKEVNGEVVQPYYLSYNGDVSLSSKDILGGFIVPEVLISEILKELLEKGFTVLIDKKEELLDAEDTKVEHLIFNAYIGESDETVNTREPKTLEFDVKTKHQRNQVSKIWERLTFEYYGEVLKEINGFDILPEDQSSIRFQSINMFEIAEILRIEFGITTKSREEDLKTLKKTL